VGAVRKVQEIRTTSTACVTISSTVTRGAQRPPALVGSMLKPCGPGVMQGTHSEPAVSGGGLGGDGKTRCSRPSFPTLRFNGKHSKMFLLSAPSLSPTSQPVALPLVQGPSARLFLLSWRPFPLWHHPPLHSFVMP
jgi:hypothetical protein